MDAKIYEINFRVKRYGLSATKEQKHPTNALATGVSEFSSRREAIEKILKDEYGIEF